MKIEIAIGIDGAWVVMSHPSRNAENDSTITALFEQHQYDARVNDTFDLPPGIYRAEVVWKCDGDPNDPTNDGHYVEVQPAPAITAARALSQRRQVSEASAAARQQTREGNYERMD